ncbi:MAG: hypothetical protein JNJ57_02125 [Saprospiraceae bacterium]|nr:hypothetical protein [Saprospiraceae bacterium]
MKTSILVAMLTLFCSVVAQAQDVIPDSKDHGSLIFESASFLDANACEHLTIRCKSAGLLTDFEFKGKDSHILFSWDGDSKPQERFPMKLTTGAGKVKIRYKMKGGEWKVLFFELEKGNNTTITLS